MHAGRHVALERREHPLALALVQGAREPKLLVDPAAAHVLLEEALAESPGALVGVLLRGDELSRDLGGRSGPAEPHAGEERLGRRPDLHDELGCRTPEARRPVAVEPELAVGDVLDDEEAVPTGKLDQRRAPLVREANSGGVLVVGDGVEELRAQPIGQAPLELFDVETVLVERNRDDVRLESCGRP